MNHDDEHNERIRRTGRVFVDGVNQTRCSNCGRLDAEYQGDENEDGESIALCMPGEGCADDDDNGRDPGGFL